MVVIVDRLVYTKYEFTRLTYKPSPSPALPDQDKPGKACSSTKGNSGGGQKGFKSNI